MKRRICSIIVLLFCFSALAVQRGYGEVSREYAIKAAFLLNFAKYVEWPGDDPKDENAPLVVGILGKDPFGAVIDSLGEKKTVIKRPLVVKRFKNIDAIEPCQILFVSSSNEDDVKGVLLKLKDTPTLMVADFDGFAKDGGHINYRLVENKVRFIFNLKAVKAVGLKVRSEILKVAIEVIK
ncbi:MAG: YfiR family protein [bacterium]